MKTCLLIWCSLCFNYFYHRGLSPTSPPREPQISPSNRYSIAPHFPRGTIQAYGHLLCIFSGNDYRLSYNIYVQAFRVTLAVTVITPTFPIYP